MSSFIDIAFSYPTGVLSALLLVVLFYWILAMVGLVDFESSHVDIDLHLHVHSDTHLDTDASDLGSLASHIVAMGLNGAPFSVVVSLLVLVSWTLTALFAEWLLPLVPGALPKAVAGTLAMIVSFAMAIVITAWIVRPLRKLFVTHGAVSNASIVGQTCSVVTQTVDEHFGRAEVRTNGSPINIRVWAVAPNALCKGATARILEYDPDTSRYLIVAE